MTIATSVKGTKVLHLGIIGPGLVGSEFLAQVRAFQLAPKTAAWSLSVVAISNSRTMVLSTDKSSGGILLDDWKTALESSATKADLGLLSKHVSTFKNGVLIDCTASESVALEYGTWIDNGLSIITPNKKAFSSSMESWNSLFSLASERGVGLFHESTVGYVSPESLGLTGNLTQFEPLEPDCPSSGL
jgi:homoserine dehydrogenase